MANSDSELQTQNQDLASILTVNVTCQCYIERPFLAEFFFYLSLLDSLDLIAAPPQANAWDTPELPHSGSTLASGSIEGITKWMLEIASKTSWHCYPASTAFVLCKLRASDNTDPDLCLVLYMHVHVIF